MPVGESVMTSLPSTIAVVDGELRDLIASRHAVDGRRLDVPLRGAASASLSTVASAAAGSDSVRTIVTSGSGVPART